MLEQPDLKKQELINYLRAEFGLKIAGIHFLPLGADLNTAVYRADTNDGSPYFVKLRRGVFNQAIVSVPRFLTDQDNKYIIPSLITKTGELWAELGPFKVIVYPYVEGKNGFEAKMADQQWVAFGRALKRFHTAAVPPEITRGLPREEFSPRWRNIVCFALTKLIDRSYEDPVAMEMAAFLKRKHNETVDLIVRTERLARILHRETPGFILCHADIHLWNLLLDDAGMLYFIDWDTMRFAPKERDLMFVGAGLGNSGFTPQEETVLFYQGYGPTEINPTALAYYRYERIIEDIAIYCEQIFLSNEGGKDREQALSYLKSNYKPGGTIEVARNYDQAPHIQKFDRINS